LLLGSAIVLVVPLLNDVWTITAVVTVARAAGSAGSGLGLALIIDLVRNRSDIGRATSLVLVGSNLFGMMVAPIVIGNLMARSGGHDAVFAVAGILSVCGCIVVLTMTRGPVDTTEPRRMPAALGGAIGTGFARYAIFYGRASRSEYWWFWLFAVVCDLVATALINTDNVAVVVLGLIIYLVLILPTAAVGVRRMHDIDRSGWWLLFGMIPTVGTIALLIWYCTSGERGTNRFGEPPLLST
jgi:uncharacterized membrane protein YhaH (DUF805 family)